MTIYTNSNSPSSFKLSTFKLFTIALSLILLCVIANLWMLWSINNDVKIWSAPETNEATYEIHFFSEKQNLIGSDPYSLYGNLEELIPETQVSIEFSQFQDLEKRIPNFADYFSSLVSRTDNTLASFPCPLSPCSPYDPKFKVPMLGYATDYGKLWRCIAFSQISKKPPFEVAKILLCTALIGTHVESESSIMGKMVGIICRAVAGDGIIRAAKHLRLSLPESQFVVSQLQAIENHIPSISSVWLEMKRLWRLEKDHFLGHSNYKKAPGKLFWFPGFFAKRFMSDESVCQKIEDFYFNKIISLPSKPWSLIKTKLDGFRTFERNLKTSLKDVGLNNLRYFLLPKEFFIDKYCTREPSVISIIDQEYSARQALRSAQWAISAYCYFNERGKWPTNQEEIEELIKIPLPDDFFSGKRYIFRTGDPPDIREVGPDLIPDTEDDRKCILK